MVSDFRASYNADGAGGGDNAPPWSIDLEVAVSEARGRLAELVNRAAYRQDRIRLTRRGKAVAALVPIEDLEWIEALEDKIDLAAAREALADRSEPSIPWEQVKAELGL